MELRKLIGFGKSSLVVSLPKTWLTQNKLKKGDTIYLHEAEDQLVINSRQQSDNDEPKIIQINTEGKDLDKISSEIISAYLRNYDIWELRGRNLAQQGPKVKEILQNLAGMELMEQDSTKIVARDLMDISEISIQSLIRRIDLILRSMLQDCTVYSTEDYYESIFHRDLDVNRLVHLLQRVISLALENTQVAKKLARTPRQLVFDMQMSNLLEGIGDDVKRVARFIKDVDRKSKAFKDLVKMNEELHKNYLTVMKAYHTDNKSLAYDVESTHKIRMEEIDKISKLTSSHTAHRCLYHMKGLNSHLKNMSRRILS